MIKTLTIVALFLSTILGSKAQFKLKGKAIGADKRDSVSLNIPFVFGYYLENSIKIPISNIGLFNINIDLREQKFATLEYKGKEHILLLTPGRSLSITLDVDSTIKYIDGEAAIENRLLDELQLNEIPFFARRRGDLNLYASLSYSDLQSLVFQPWMARRDKMLENVQNSKLSYQDKRLISQEVKADAVNELYYFIKSMIDHNRGELIDILLTELYNDVSITPDILSAGPSYYRLADTYVRYMENLTLSKLQNSSSTVHSAGTIKLYNISPDSLNVLITKRGKVFTHWLAIHTICDKRVAEAMLAQAIAVQCQEKKLVYVLPLMETLEKTYPQSPFRSVLSSKVNSLKKELLRNQKNESIQIAQGFEKLKSIYPLISQFKGKVIYLDIWGTWCSPCQDELHYNPQMKMHFKDKNVIFIYLDMDDDDKDSYWREYITINNITGLHLRKSSKDIKPFWEELQILKNKRNRYPAYFIFDKNGKLITETAKRPSEQFALYEQIEKYL